MLSASTSAIQPLDKRTSISDSSSSFTSSPTTQSPSASTTVTSILPLGQTNTVDTTSALSTEAQTSTISLTSALLPTLTTPILSSSTLATTSESDSKTESKTVSAGTTPISTTPGAFDTSVAVGNLLQDSGTNNVSDSLNVTDATTQNSTNTTKSSFEQTTSEENFESTPFPVTHNNITNASDITVSLSSSSPTTTTEKASTHALTSSVTTSVKSSTFDNPTTKTGSTDNAEPTSTRKIPTSTHSSNGDKSKQSPTSCEEKDSSFGEYGLPLVAVALAICVVEFIIILVMMARASKQKRKRRMSDEEKAIPKLKMLEIKDDTTKRSTNDDLHVYSLDYEKHVQEKIEEHKKKTKPPVAEKPIGGVSSFMLNKQESLRSNLSNASSPDSPLSPAENKPLIKYHRGDDGDEPVVFNFSKRPSEILTKRRESGADEAGRRKSNASAGKFKAVPKDKYDTDI
ncbi:uncharacterized protein LOC123527135 isoform X2 [Mercenaria mercenaria]|nr:uncharacterized protein LOC123527135 isoform X2 [Mercenaria mercenaria]